MFHRDVTRGFLKLRNQFQTNRYVIREIEIDLSGLAKIGNYINEAQSFLNGKHSIGDFDIK